MIALIKGLIPGILLTWIVCGLIGSNGSTGGILHIFHASIGQFEIYWSWSLFIASTGLAWLIFALLE
jgi:hypothetical protein